MLPLRLQEQAGGGVPMPLDGTAFSETRGKLGQMVISLEVPF